MKLKRLIPLLAAVICTQVNPPSTIAADALTLSNPGFEKQLSDWETEETDVMSKAEAEAAHTGKAGLRVNDDSEQAGSSLTSQKIPVSAGKTYQVQFWSRVLSGYGVGVYLRFLKADGKPVVPGTEEERTAERTPAVDLDKNQLSWALTSGKRTAPADAVTMMIYIHSYSKHKVIADFDDFVISEVAR